jgi:outer membrane biosynthesis protein TonB
LRTAAIAYPADAKSEGIEGTVRPVPDQGGWNRGRLRVLGGDSRLSSVVVEAVKRWKYQPATFEGRAVPTWQQRRSRSA